MYELRPKKVPTDTFRAGQFPLQGVLFGMKQAGINQGFWVVFLGLIPWFSTITHYQNQLILFPPPPLSELFKSVVPFFFY
jgi:hypothetical protein